jgi:hypothetical protein
VNLANKYGVKISATWNDLTGGGNHGNWQDIPHIHLGDIRVHIAFSDEALQFLKRLLLK